MDNYIISPFEKINRFRKHETVVKALKEHADNFITRTLLQLNFDERIVLRLPKISGVGDLPDEVFHIGSKRRPVPKQRDVEATIRILGGIATANNQLRREVLFKQLVSELDTNELEIVILCLNRELETKYKSITRERVLEVFSQFNAA